MDALALTKQKANEFETVLNKRLYLFKLERSYLQLAPPQVSRKDGNYKLYIPESGGVLPLIDRLGFISGSLSYSVENGNFVLKKYSFKFEHESTYIQLHEDEPLDKIRYGFHFDMDKDRAALITHPEQHLQFLPLSVPRFATPSEPNELTVFAGFLDLIEKTFYTNSAGPRQKPQLECANVYLSQYQ